MTTFNLKQVTIPLFGEVENNTATWLAAFATAGVTTPLQFDDAVLDLIASELELDAEGLLGNVDRYVRGQYRAKACGLGGTCLGDLGEILTFLVNRAVPNREIARVVSWRRGPGQPVKGSRFPQPDFIIEDPGNAAAALEVKSTEAFDFTNLRDNTNEWTHLKPCSFANRCRKQALPQLAYTGGTLTPQEHSLLRKDGKLVPFPVGKGIATAVAAVDGRINELRTDQRFRTPPACRNASRYCWSCVPANCHFVLVTMPNIPGALSLAGPCREGFTWIRAYARWSQALAARDLIAVRATLPPLVEALAGWLGETGVHEPNVLRAFWGSYLSDAMRSRGFDIDVPRTLGDLESDRFNYEWSPASLSEVANREVSIDTVWQTIIASSQDGKTAAPFLLSARLQGDDDPSESLSVDTTGDFVEFRLASSTWWRAEKVPNTETASKIAARLFALALKASRHPAAPHLNRVPVRALAARVGEQTIVFGWESIAATADPELWWRFLRGWPTGQHHRRWRWSALLAAGDPRTRLRVLSDGRAHLRIHKSLLFHDSPP